MIVRFRKLAFLFMLHRQPNAGALLQRRSHRFSKTILQSHEADEHIDLHDGLRSKKWLVVGDGDLSYSATIAERLSRSGFQLYSTVLEDETDHNNVYKRSLENSRAISKYENHRLMFGVDATKLALTFPNTTFDCIEFNFPHWRGKTNNRYNRQLLSDFFQSAASVIRGDGEIRVALCDGQGGIPAKTMDTWKQSWMAAMYAGMHGLLLKRIEPYKPEYSLSSHRGVDRPFALGTNPVQYIFSLPDGDAIERNLQISCRHELRIVLDGKLQHSPVSYNDVVNGDAVVALARRYIPDGIRFEVPAKEIIDIRNSLEDTNPSVLSVFLLNYSGEKQPLSRNLADSIRAQIENAVISEWGLDVAKAGRMVSKPYPCALLADIIQEYNLTKQKYQ